MRTLLVCVLMIGALLVFSVTPAPLVQAQDKKEKDKDKKPTKAGTIVIAEGKDGKFRFSVRDGDDKFLAQSSLAGFASEKEAREGINYLKEVIAKAKVTVKKPEKEKGK